MMIVFGKECYYMGRTVCIDYGTEKEKGSRYIQEASAPAAVSVRPVTKS
jgi:hypothetical protein